ATATTEELKDSEAAPDWILNDDEISRAVLIAEYFRVEVDEDTGQRRVFWSVINGIEVLAEEQEWNGCYIPIIPTIGRELIPFDEERRWVGIIEPNKDAVRLINYAASTAVEMAALEPKAPFIMAEGQQEGHEKEWLMVNVRNFPYLLYKPKNLGGELAPP